MNSTSSSSLSRLLIVASLFATGLLAGCATPGPADPRDPLESVNRATFEFNDDLDRAVLAPVARGYTYVIPEPVRDCVGNVFGNMSDAWTAVNNLLEGNPHDGGSDICRVAVNTTVGLGGCFDVASGMGLDKHKKDFGLTLGVWGFAPGPYIVLPLFGPSDLRDSAGLVVDFETDPVGYLYPTWQRNIIEGVRVIDARSQLLNAGNLLDSAALDKYVFVRDGYFTRRRSQIYNGNPPDEPDDTQPNPLQTPQQPAPPAGGAPMKTSFYQILYPDQATFGTNAAPLAIDR
jgi:phospholipid-binding lipoprotein MlaA